MSDASSQPRQWWTDAVFYEVPVKAIFDADGNGYGDFRGLMHKLDYVQDLGATALWLLPFFASPLKDDGFDVSDYREVHPALGTLADFQSFLEAAHRRALHVVGELPINHTSDEHPWFQASRAAPRGSELRAYYIWREEQPREDSGFRAGRRGRSTHWSWDSTAGEFYFHRFFEHQPDLNYAHPAVREEISRVIAFWLDHGLDGLCLNGASVLHDGSGTAPEHLPANHAALREFRAAVDREFPGRILQAGLNAGPEVARDYFGNADECQLVPHLALTEKLFVSLAQENCGALVDILQRTAPLPQDTQWVLFLRNHDELQLKDSDESDAESVAAAFATEPQMRERIQLARRLAPLVENDRRRQELLFALLFSLPGAPAIYYGEELGMGDNPFLGEREGLRLPMPWNADRNGGFSSADVARLYAPPPSDPVYGYGAVNVEASRRDPSSLFHAVRRQLSARARISALARGSLTLIESDNPCVFAFVRSDLESAVLVVANLACSAQAAELNLCEYAGATPIEVTGRSPFPRVSRAPYRVTLTPFGFFWLELRHTSRPRGARRVSELPCARSLPEVSWTGQWDSVLQGPGHEQLAREALPRFIQAQRWFGSKARQIQNVQLEPLTQLPFPGGDAEDQWLAIAHVEFEGAGRESYLLPLAIADAGVAQIVLEHTPDAAIAMLSRPGEKHILYDAVANDDLVRLLADSIASAAEWPAGNGTIRGVVTRSAAELRGSPDRVLRVRRGPATSSNSLCFLGSRLLLKVYRRLESGANPDVEIGRFLTEQGSFDRTPRLAGQLEFSTPGGTMVLAVLQELVPNRGDGWKDALDALGRYYARAAARQYSSPVKVTDQPSLLLLSASAPPLGVLETMGSYRRTAGILGRRTAEMHRSLAERTDDQSFAAESFTEEQRDALVRGTLSEAQNTFRLLRARINTLDPSASQQATELLARTDFIERAIPSRLPRAAGERIRVHGDYHLGQVLAVDDDFVILDFEGEPARSLEERRLKQPPLKDVAGMIRSFHYAAYAALFEFTKDRASDFERLEPWGILWYRWVAAAFLREYLRSAGAAAWLPQAEAEIDGLLSIFMLEKAFYELAYELNNRPGWVRIPLRGILDLL